MSRIHDILSKAERDGTARRTRPAASVPADAEAPTGADRIGVAPVSLLDSDGATPSGYSGHNGSAVAFDPADPAESAGGPQEISGVTLHPALIAALAPQSQAAEQYRSLRTRISRSETGRVVRTIAVTSPSKGEGKSVSAANLALTMAQEFQRRVLLLDADLRHPRAHHLFGLSVGAGLAEVLAGTADLASSLVSLPEHHLTLLPAGVPPTHPAELLSSSAMRRVIEALRQQYDRIIIDLPPATPLADAQILAPLVDGILLIVRAGMTTRPAIETALNGFERSKMLGLVLNDAATAPDGDGDKQEYAAKNA